MFWIETLTLCSALPTYPSWSRVPKNDFAISIIVHKNSDMRLDWNKQKNLIYELENISSHPTHINNTDK